jgi:hypothetical protein
MDFVTLFENATVAGIPLLIFVLALVQWVKSFGVSGNYAKATSMAIGLVLGVGYQLTLSAPTDFAGWFTTVVFGLALGLGASGVYEMANSPVAKG